MQRVIGFMGSKIKVMDLCDDSTDDLVVIVDRDANGYLRAVTQEELRSLQEKARSEGKEG